MHYLLMICALSLAACASQIKKPFLWSIEKDGHKSYLMGTMHVGVLAADMPPVVLQKVDESNLVVTEVPGADIEKRIAKHEKEKAEGKTNTDGVFLPEDGPTLDELVSERAWNVLLSVRGELSVNDLKRFRPEAIAGLYHLARYGRQENLVRPYVYHRLQARNMLDLNLYQYGRDHGKAVGHVEEVEMDPQRKACEYTMEAETLERVIFSENEKETYVDALVRGIEAYETGDETKMTWLFANTGNAQNRCLFTERHERWLPQIEQMHSAHAPVFFAFGVAHMLHPNESLLKALRERGFTIQRVQ